MNTQPTQRFLCKRLKRMSLSLFLVTVFLSASSAQAKDSDFSRAQKELKIMSKIFETSLNEQKDKQSYYSRSRKTGATYLARQGMLFRFSFGSSAFVYKGDGWEALGAGIGNLVGSIANEVGAAFADVPVTPTAPVAPIDDDWADEFAAEYETQVGAYQQRLEELELMREAQREQRDQVRRLQRNIRSLERDKARSSDEKKALEKYQRELAAKQQQLAKKMKDYKAQMKAYRTKRDQEYRLKAKNRADLILTTLCDYGPTLRSLKNDEHVTLIFTQYANNKDRVYVLSAKSVKNCDSKEQLLKHAINYQI